MGFFVSPLQPMTLYPKSQNPSPLFLQMRHLDHVLDVPGEVTPPCQKSLARFINTARNAWITGKS